MKNTGIPSLSGHCFMLSYRVYDDEGKVLGSRERSFGTLEQAVTFAKDNGLEGFVFEMTNPMGQGTSKEAARIPEDIEPTEMEQTTIRVLSYLK